MKSIWLAIPAAVLIAAIAGSSGAQAPNAKGPQAPSAKGQGPTLWWNDPMIVDEISLTAQQRQKMDAAYEQFHKRTSEGPRTGDLRNEFFEAVEAGDWKRGRSILETWREQAVVPIQAMGDLKLEVMPLLSAEQREKLMASYPRIVKRQWRPVVRWAGKPPEGGPHPGMKPGGSPKK